LEARKLSEAADREMARSASLCELPSVLHDCLRTGHDDLPWHDMTAKGWRQTQGLWYCPASPRVAAVSDQRLQMRRDRRDLWRLAEDVVVISLPERTDRQVRFSEFMAQEKVRFRFVDGVRVTDEEIDPQEIAEVEEDRYKLAGGWKAYLRGTVGCRRAYLRCLEEAYAAGIGSLLIMEDDAHLEEGWEETYAAALGELPRGWLQLYLSAWHFQPAQAVSPHLHRLTGAYQTTAILYSAAGIEAAVRAARCSRCDIDAWLAKRLHPFGHSYVITPGITFQDGGYSDIRSVDRGVTP
jgi:hypothetical protein